MELHTNIWTILGLGIALFGPFIILNYNRNVKTNFDSLVSKFSLWVLVIFILLIIFYGENETLLSIGFKKVTSKTFFAGFAGGVGTMFIMGITQVILKKLGFNKPEKSFEKIIKQSFNRRLFVIITAVFVEEILYRGYAIERLSLLIDNIWIAGFISTIIFTVNHIYRWSILHLIPVFFSGLLLAILYIITRDITVCLIAHFIVDAVAFIFMPYLLRKKMAHN